MYQKYDRVGAYINQEALKQNIERIRQEVPKDVEIIGVVKANAYGHGIENVCPVLVNEGVNRFAVAVTSEGIELRRFCQEKLKVHPSILILGFTSPQDTWDILEYDLTATVFTYEMARALSEQAVRKGQQARIHIALDTGMSRIGFPCLEKSVMMIREISELPGIQIEGIFTHFAESDTKDKTKARIQLARYMDMVDQLEKAGVSIPLRHVSNSAAIMEMPEAQFEAVRAGIILYGLSPSGEMDTERFRLHPVMELRSHIVYIKEIENGTEVSYGGTYTAKGTRRIGTLPLGYADGYSRALSNKGTVLVHGKRAPIAGRICMDQMMIDLTDIPEAREMDEVVLFGEGLPLDELAELCGTITYEMTCQVSPRVPRFKCR